MVQPSFSKAHPGIATPLPPGPSIPRLSRRESAVAGMRVLEMDAAWIPSQGKQWALSQETASGMRRSE